MTEKDVKILELRQKHKAYEDTGLTPGEFDRLCREMSNIRLAFGLKTYDDLPKLIQDGTISHLRELMEVEKDGRLVVLPAGVTVQGLQNEYSHAKHLEKEQLPSLSYTTGHIAGFYAGVVSVLEKIFTRKEAEAALERGEDDLK